jgi:AIPR protein
MNIQLFINSYLEKIDTKFGFNDASQAFEIFSMAAIIDRPFDEIHSDISTLVKNDGDGFNGQHDGGIDGIYFDESTSTLTILQAKHAANLRDNEIVKFISDYQNLFERANHSNIPLNDNIKAKLDAVWSLSSKGITYSAKLFFVFNGIKEGQNKEIVDRHCAANPYLEIWDSKDLYNQIDNLRSRQRKRKEVQFTFDAERSNLASPHDPQGLITYAKSNVMAANFRLKAQKLCELIDKEIETNGHDDHLYSQNIRGFLGKVRTNEQIKETLIGKDAIYFPFLNNGITIIADKVTIPSALQANKYPIQTINPVIVNGLQSTQVIYDVYKADPSKLEDVDVMIRLYQTQDEALAEKITTATNTQTSINIRDKMSNQDFNQHLKVLFENKGIGYITKRGGSFENDLSKGLSQSISSEVLLKFWFATYYERPETAKASKNQVLELIYDATNDPTEPLHKYFSGNPDAPIYAQMLDVFKIHEVVTTKRSYASQNTPDFVQHADELLSYGMYKSFINSNQAAFGMSTTDLDKTYSDVFNNVEKTSSAHKTKLSEAGKTYSHNNYFKSAQSRIDLNGVFNWFEAEL